MMIKTESVVELALISSVSQFSPNLFSVSEYEGPLHCRHLVFWALKAADPRQLCYFCLNMHELLFS